MSQPRQVPSIAPQRQSFSRANQPAIQHPMMVGTHPSPQSVSVTDEVRELALSIYSALAVSYIEANQVPEPRAMRHLAKHAKSAALAYLDTTFEEVARDEGSNP